MKVIIAGPRTIKDLRVVVKAIAESGWLTQIEEVVSGTAEGVDRLGEKWARMNGIKIKRFPADWNNISVPGAVVKENNGKKYNARAGIDRNQKMAEYADALIAVVNGSRGTADMVRRAQRMGLKIHIHNIET